MKAGKGRSRALRARYASPLMVHMDKERFSRYAVRALKR